MVTASEGRLKRTITSPLNRPASVPATNTMAITSGMGKPMCQSTPISALDAPSTDATDKSISAATMINVIGKAISAISVKSASMFERLALERNTGDNTRPRISPSASTTTSMVSHERCRRLVKASAESGLAMIAFPHHAARDRARQQCVERDRRDDQRSLNGLLPERRYAQHHQRNVDHAKHERAKRRAKDGAHAPCDRHAAHHGCGHHLQLDALRGARFDRAETRQPQHAREARNRAGQQEADHHAALYTNTCKPCGFGVRPDRVMLTPAAILLQIDANREQHDHRDQNEIRQAKQRTRGDARERIRKAGRVDLAAVDPGVIGTAHDIQRRQSCHQRRHAPERDQRAVHRTNRQADGYAREHRNRYRHVRKHHEETADRIRADTDNGRYRQIDMPHQHHHRHARGEQADDRYIEQDVAQILQVQELGFHRSGGRDQCNQHDKQGRLAAANELCQQVAAFGLGRAHGGHGGRMSCHHAAFPNMEGDAPSAALITRSSLASARAISALMRPSCMTRMRSAMPSTSGSSLEIIRTAMPSRTSSASVRYTSALAPTSIPRVGSSMINTLGPVASHFPSTTFCWLPPDSVPTGASRSLALSRRRLPQSAASVFSLRDEINPCLTRRPSTVKDALRAMLSSSARPCARRSSGTSANPARTAACGRPSCNGLPAI